MPLQRCTTGGAAGYRWGNAGKCYAGADGRSRALAQGRAVEGSRKALDDVLGATDLWIELRRQVVEIVRPLFLRSYVYGGELALEEIPAEIVTDAVVTADKATRRELSDRIRRAAAIFIDEYLDEWWLQLQASTQEALREAVQLALAEGRGAAWVMDRIAPLFAPERVERIAVTETTRLMGGGAQETYRAVGYVGWQWRTVNDPLVDPICASLQAQSSLEPFPMSRRFSPAHPNCRCFLAPVGPVVRPP